MALPNFLKPKHSYSLKRIGSNNDGGYLVGKNSLKKANCLISFGINDDWSFELSLKKIRNNISIFCYDDQLCFKFLLKNFIIQLILVFSNCNFNLLKNRLNVLITYFFFLGKVNYCKKRINNKNFNKIFFKKKNILLKIDIEGSEYRILDKIIKIQNKLEGLIIEFHEVHLNIKRIKKFVKQLKLKLIHTHGNNFGKLDNFNDPTLLELTFEKNSSILDNNPKFPNFLDNPNNKKKIDLILKFI